MSFGYLAKFNRDETVKNELTEEGAPEGAPAVPFIGPLPAPEAGDDE